MFHRCQILLDLTLIPLKSIPKFKLDIEFQNSKIKNLSGSMKYLFWEEYKFTMSSAGIKMAQFSTRGYSVTR